MNAILVLYSVEEVLSMLISFHPIVYVRTGGRYREVREATYLLYTTRTNSFERQMSLRLKSSDAGIQQKLSSSSHCCGPLYIEPSAQYQFVSGFNET